MRRHRLTRADWEHEATWLLEAAARHLDGRVSSHDEGVAYGMYFGAWSIAQRLGIDDWPKPVDWVDWMLGREVPVAHAA